MTFARFTNELDNPVYVNPADVFCFWADPDGKGTLIQFRFEHQVEVWVAEAPEVVATRFAVVRHSGERIEK
jgi:hypothetical protein